MTCKYLTTTTKIIPGGSEVGGSLTPQGITVPACKLSRKPVITFWASKCKETDHDGPCWYWIEEHGNMPDLEF